jgi:hypothetical protein
MAGTIGAITAFTLALVNGSNLFGTGFKPTDLFYVGLFRFGVAEGNMNLLTLEIEFEIFGGEGDRAIHVS